MADIFFDIGFIIIIATAFAFIAKLFRQPLIPAYILTGLVIGPFLGLITNTDVIITMSEIGIAFLLFIVGLEIDLRKLGDVGVVSTIGGLTQIMLVFTVSFIISIFIGFIQIEAVYLALIIAFSSTMIVVKLLSDKRQLDTLHGRIILGILLMQDIAAIFALSVLTTLSEFSLLALLLSIIKGIVVFCRQIPVPGNFHLCGKKPGAAFHCRHIHKLPVFNFIQLYRLFNCNRRFCRRGYTGKSALQPGDNREDKLPAGLFFSIVLCFTGHGADAQHF